MNRALSYAAPLFAVLALAACNAGGTSNTPASAGQSVSQSHQTPQWQLHHTAVAACPGARVNGFMQCDALISTSNRPNMKPDVAGLAPIDFQTRYNLPSGTKGSGTIVAIVDAFDNPNVTSDLAMYRSNFGLGTANFTKYNQTGQIGNYPQGSPGWGVEIDLDVEMVSAVCPKCTIYLIEANDNSTNNLYSAEAEAVSLGAHIISNSYSGCCSASGGSFDHPGVTYLASAGDSGYGIGDPADYDNVVSVGGTVLSKSGSPPTYTEGTWPDTGGGCSEVTKPSWQHDTGCSFRTSNDVSAVAQGVAEYDSYSEPGWFTVGGTSVSSPMLGGVFGLTKNYTKQHGGENFWKQKAKKYAKDLHDITTGADGSCGGSYLCKAAVGYDGPTGWGTPNGTKAF
ncbi:MAG: S53 family peptidase [Candidatus Baltobacteraceae bacterium]